MRPDTLRTLFQSGYGVRLEKVPYGLIMLTELLKTAIKFGLKSAAPVLGALGAELASTAATKLVDRASDAALKDLHQRIFQRVSYDLASALGSEQRLISLPTVKH